MEYFVVMTGELPGYSMHTASGTIDVYADATRQGVYEKAYQELLVPHFPDRPNVIFFSLEPNELGVTNGGQAR